MLFNSRGDPQRARARPGDVLPETVLAMAQGSLDARFLAVAL